MARERPDVLVRNFRCTRLIDVLATRPFENLGVEGLEVRPVIEMREMGEFVAERVHEARVLERLARGRMSQPDPNRPVRVANPVTAFDIRALRLEHAIAQPKTRADPQRIGFEASQKFLLCPAIHASPPPDGSFGTCWHFVNALRGGPSRGSYA